MAAVIKEEYVWMGLKTKPTLVCPWPWRCPAQDQLISQLKIFSFLPILGLREAIGSVEHPTVAARLLHHIILHTSTYTSNGTCQGTHR